MYSSFEHYALSTLSFQDAYIYGGQKDRANALKERKMRVPVRSDFTMSIRAQRHYSVENLLAIDSAIRRCQRKA